MFSTIISGALDGIRAYPVQVEVDVSTGLPGFIMVGSLGSEVREARERVQVALKNKGFEIPPMKITVNLAPANCHKEGTAFDLPIACGILEAMGFYSQEAVRDTLIVGELGLDGEIKPVKGVLPIVREAARLGLRQCIVPFENRQEGAVIPGITVRGAGNIRQLVQFFRGDESLLPAATVDTASLFLGDTQEESPDFSEVVGQEAAKRAAEIAAAGFHNMLMTGPPGAGKSMIARRIPGIMSPLDLEESLEVSAVYSVAGLLKESQSLIVRRPFQSPHHTITRSALAGGGTIPRPGMISLAHRGVLFLDELPEFARTTLDSMRQPIEEKEVRIARVGGSAVYPADFILICAMNPCICGYYPDLNRCTCTEKEVRRYLGRVSGPIIDRIDLCVEILPVDVMNLKNSHSGESSKDISRRVAAARKRQKERYQNTRYRFNADVESADTGMYFPLGKKEQRVIEQAYKTMGLSVRAYHRILKVARTIADLEGADRILTRHLTEAVGYRMMDSAYWKR